MKALILAAGYATRLYPLTREFPKPLLTVRHKPIINYILDKLELIKDIDEIIVVTNSKFISRFKSWNKGLRCKKRVSLVDDLTKDESDKRGAIGDMGFAIEAKRIKDDLLVVGGDNLFDGGLDSFVSFAGAKRPHPAIGVYHIGDMRQGKKYGVVKLDKYGRIVDFREKPEKPQSPLVAMCLYYFPAESLGLIREYLGGVARKQDATGFYIDWLRKRAAVYGFVFRGRWYDIGDRKFLDEAKERF
jgi:glucose-1-phosphate thymidylyltransferase